MPTLWQAEGFMTANGSATITQRFVATAPNGNNTLGGEMDTAMDTQTRNAWSREAPTTPGLYHFACEEQDSEWLVLRVGRQADGGVFDRVVKNHHTSSCPAFRPALSGFPSGALQSPGDELLVSCPDTGLWPVREYHDGLTEPRWRLIDVLEAEQLAADRSAAA